MTETTSSKPPDERNTKFECNICFDDVKDPVVTRCGHLFCWSCILSWMNRDNYHCPMCHAGISKENVIPLYGHGENQTDPRNKAEEPRPKAERPASQPTSNSFWGGYDGRISISFGAFPFSLVMPIAFGSSTGGPTIFNLFRRNDATANMTPEQRRAYTHSVFLVFAGTLMIVYLLFCI